MRPKNAFTLVEVIISIALLGAISIFIINMTQGYLMMSKGVDYTVLTFNAQDEMEELLVSEKQKFVDDKDDLGTEITVFGKTVNIKGVSVSVLKDSNRTYAAYVTKYVLPEPLAPVLDDFKVKVYLQGTETEAFPWYEDSIEIYAKYNINPEPAIYQSRNRWYISSDGEKNPVFPSNYEVYSEEVVDNPKIKYEDTLAKNTTGTPLLPKRFYYFEARPFTIEGKIALERNEDRILVLNRNGSDLWQDFIENAHFERVKALKPDTTVDVMQNPDWPTLDLGWESRKDPEGAMLSTSIPASIGNKAFKSRISFEMDKDALVKNTTVLGAGVSLQDDSNNGYMLTFDAINNKINLNKLHSGEYDGDQPLKTIDVLTDPALEKFRVTVAGKAVFDWTKSFYTTLIYKPEEKQLEFQLEFMDTGDKLVSSDLVSIDLVEPLVEPKQIGFKAYSGLKYTSDQQFEISDKYERNYSAHFYNLTVNTLDAPPEDDVVDIIIKENIFVYGSKIDFNGDEVIGVDSAVFISDEGGTLEYANLNGGAIINVSNIYIQGKVDLDFGGADLGSPLHPGEIHVDNDVRFGHGGRDIYGDMYIHGDFRNGHATIHGDVFVDGDFGLGSGIGRSYYDFLNQPGHVYYTGDLIEMPSYFDLSRIGKLATKVDYVKPAEIPPLEMPTYHDRDWYLSRGYTENSSVRLEDNMKLYVDSFNTTWSWLPTTKNVIIVAKSGDITIQNMGNSTLTGILFAPNGKVTFSGKRFEGLVIAKDGFYVPSGGTVVEFISALNFVNSEDVPLKAPDK